MTIENKQVMTIGFEPENINLEGFIWVNHSPGVQNGLTEKEYYLLCKHFIDDTDILIVNLNKENLSVDEVILLHLAYTISTPIFAVGHKMLLANGILKELVSHRFGDLEELKEHLIDNYKS